jgi:uncharacterized protein (TIGR03435 family)
VRRRWSARSARALGCFAAAALLLRTAAAQDAFEVAFVKPADPISNPVVGFRAYPGGRVVVTNNTLKMVIAESYGVPLNRVTGGPPWADEDLYNITAKPPSGSVAAAFMPPQAYAFPSPELLSMMRTLVSDRFNVRLHRETCQWAVLALVVGKGTPKLELARDPTSPPREPRRKEQNEWRSITMQRLAARLEAHYHRTVLDRTGLTGTYDFNLSYDPQVRDTIDSPEAPIDATGTSFKTALETQIGLRLQETKAPVEVLVIDQAKRPTAN